MPNVKRQKTETLKKRGFSLRIKLVSFTIFLVLMVVLIVSIPLSVMMRKTQEQTLAVGLLDRVNVLLESLASQVKVYLPQENVVDLSFVAAQGNSLEEAVFITITGLASSESGADDGLIDYVWATSDSGIAGKINTGELNPGFSRLISDDERAIYSAGADLNERAIAEVSKTAKDIDDLALLDVRGTSLEDQSGAAVTARLNDIRKASNQLNEKLTASLNSLSKEGSGSIPPYDPSALDRANTKYLFYKPILYRQDGEADYLRGMVLVEISTGNLISAVDRAGLRILTMTTLIGLAAIILGAAGSFILATIIVKPIKLLAKHVAMIRDTEDKEDLAGKDVVIGTRDEIGVLGDTVNDMVHGLVKAAAAAKDLTVGKEVQKMFIPLETDSTGRKLTTGFAEDSRTHFFGYYEGAKGVSGDYFDYKRLDDRWAAVIKCDVSGKGVPASLIMVEVATLFLNYFQDWTYEKDGTDLAPIVTRINDMIESRGFTGRFAAFTLCLLNSETGECFFCNAGDSLVNVYDSKESRKKTLRLPESPACGVFPSSMIEEEGGFSQCKIKLGRGDVLLLYTDGIEESKRIVGQSFEEMTTGRVDAVIEAVFNHRKYVLEKRSPEGTEKLEFDFSSCAGSAEDVILALVSVEKVFRMNKPPEATVFDRVQTDRKIDRFLKEHFLQYEALCGNQEDLPGSPEYIQYTYVQEDPQYDDLTLAAIKRK